MKTKYEVVKAWRKKNPEKVRDQAVRYRLKHPETSKKASLKFRESHLNEVREKDKLIKRTFRNTDKYRLQQKERYRRFVERRNAEQVRVAGRPKPENCEICQTKEFRIVWDHCHTKGHFRGWICDRCNRVLGIVRDDVQLLRTLAKYLEGQYGRLNSSNS